MLSISISILILIRMQLKGAIYNRIKRGEISIGAFRAVAFGYTWLPWNHLNI